VSFTLNNTYIGYGDVLVLNHLYGGSVGSYVLNAKCGNNSATIYITNITSAALSEDFAIVYAVIKLEIPV
jgi:predicted aconitase with swiveling domain